MLIHRVQVGGGDKRHKLATLQLPEATQLVCSLVTNHRTKRVSVDRDTEITLKLTIASSLLESSTKDFTQSA